MNTQPLTNLLGKLSGVQKHGDYFVAKCPAHEDDKASLSLTLKGGKVLLKCHAGCGFKEILSAVDVPVSALFSDSSNGKAKKEITEVYDYLDEKGELVCQTVRYFPKDFKQRRPDGKGGWIWNLKDIRTVIYNLPNVIKAKSVLIVEGERDVHSAAKIGFVATTSPMGAGKWRAHYNEFLKAKRVVIIPDNDEPGKKHAKAIARQLYGLCELVKILDLSKNPITPQLEMGPKEDLTDWISKGGKKSELIYLINKTPIFDDSDDSDDSDDKGDIRRQLTTNDDNMTTRMTTRRLTERNVAQEIKEWINQAPGRFTSMDIDKDLCLKDRTAKQNRSKVLERLVEERVIERVGMARGCFQVIDTSAETINFLDADSDSYDMWLPFDLHKMVKVMPGNLIVIAGEPNVGKTGVLLNLVRKNMFSKEIYYYSSEMEGSEFRERLSKFSDIELNQWRFYPKTRSENFHHVVQPDALNIIDYLEVHEEFYKVGGMLRLIYERLRTGIAVVAIQKNAGNDHGLGGGRGLEKPRLYLSLSRNFPHGNIAKIIKAKNYIGQNPNGKQIEFKLHNGCDIQELTVWSYPGDGSERRERYRH